MRIRHPRGPKKHFSSEPIGLLTADQLRALPGAQCEELLSLEDGSLAASLHRLPQYATAQGLAASTGARQFSLVADGELLHDGRCGRCWESIDATPEEAPMQLAVGEKGGKVLLQFSPLPEAYRVRAGAQLASTAPNAVA